MFFEKWSHGLMAEGDQVAVFVVVDEATACANNFSWVGNEVSLQGWATDSNGQSVLQFRHVQDSLGMENPTQYAICKRCVPWGHATENRLVCGR